MREDESTDKPARVALDCRGCRCGWETSESGQVHDNPDLPETIACTAREAEPAFVAMARGMRSGEEP